MRIPNSTVFKGVITNFSLNPERRFDFTIGVETEDLQRAVELGLEAIRGLSFVLEEPGPDGYVKAIGDSSITLWFGGWINQNQSSLVKARAEAIRKLKRAFEAEGISMPEPIYRVRFDNGAAAPAVGTRSKVSTIKSKKPVRKAVANDTEQDVSPDRELEKVVQQESKNLEGDLLDAEAPQEIGS